MKTKPVARRTAAAKVRRDGLAPLIAEVRQLIQSARRGAAAVVGTFQVLTNFEIGRRIVEHEQQGEARAEYGAQLLRELSARLTEEFGRGFSVSNLQFMRQFFLEFSPRIHQTPSVKLATRQKHQTLSGELLPLEIAQKPPGRSRNPLTLSWSHYVELPSKQLLKAKLLEWSCAAKAAR